MIVTWCGFQIIRCDEVRVLIDEQARDQIEEATYEIGDDHSEKDQSENTVDVLHNEREDDLFATCLIAEQRLDKLVDTVHFKECEYALDTHETDKFDDDTDLGAAVLIDLAGRLIKSADQIEGHSSEDFEEEATTLDIFEGNLSVRNLAAILAIIRQSEESENDIKSEESSDRVLCPVDHIVANIELNRSEVHRREATVYDNGKHYTIPECEEGASRDKFHLIFAAPFLLLAVIRHV